MKHVRKIIRIDETKCTGCGDCIPNCPEGALQIIDGKARLISDLFCDGLGACVGHCPEGAMSIEEREAQPYNEAEVMGNIVRQGANTIAAHLAHLREHGAMEYYHQAVAYLKQHNIPIPNEKPAPDLPCGCPASQAQTITRQRPKSASPKQLRESELSNWPIQIKLVPLSAPYLKNADLLIAADCVAAAYPAFQEELPGRILLIGCPKLDDAQFYLDKLTELFRRNTPNSTTCLHMEVPCCYGLVRLVQQAISASGKPIPLTVKEITIQGTVRE